MLILLPPSEGKTAPRRGKPVDLSRLDLPELYAARAEMLDALVALCSERTPEEAAATLGLGTTQLDLVERNAGLAVAPTARAETVYTGVLYEALDLPTLDTSARRRAARQLAIASGLFGLVRPGDRIPAYRLSADVTLPGIGKVATFWGRHLTSSVEEAAGDGLVLDLRSGAYVPFWRPTRDVAPRVATVRVLHEVNGTRKVVSHFNKATKGRLVRDLLTAGVAPGTPAALAEALADLGHHVETGASAPGKPAQLDVVVAEL